MYSLWNKLTHCNLHHSCLSLIARQPLGRIKSTSLLSEVNSKEVLLLTKDNIQKKASNAHNPNGDHVITNNVDVVFLRLCSVESPVVHQLTQTARVLFLAITQVAINVTQESPDQL